MIQAQKLSFGYFGEPLYEEASFTVSKNKKAGLMGLNGSGKSTLFRLILGEEYPDDGRVRVEGDVALVPQEVKRDEVMQDATTVKEYLETGARRKDEKYLELLSSLEMSEIDLRDKPNKMSGGQKTKLALARALLLEPDNLLLDEPTNFLDTAGTRWVMHFLGKYKKTLLVVSHDLKLMDKSLNKIVYVNTQTKKFEEYTGSYSQFIRLKSERDEALTRQIQNQQKQLKRMKKSLIKLYRHSSDKGVRQRKQLQKRIVKMEDNLPALPSEVRNIKLKIPQPAPMGELPIWLKQVGKSYGNKQILRSVDLVVKKSERVALIGKNGVGKSTLIKIMMGLLEHDSGEVRIHDKAVIGYYSQEFESFDMNQSPLEMLTRETFATEGMCRTFLAKFMFKGDQVRQQIKSLSGGEKTRLSIARLMLKSNNLLILDEPTTYLDVQSQALILDALKEYTGTMLVVSHTPDFLKGLQPDKALILPEEKQVYWDNSYLNRVAKI